MFWICALFLFSRKVEPCVKTLNGTVNIASCHLYSIHTPHLALHRCELKLTRTWYHLLIKQFYECFLLTVPNLRNLQKFKRWLTKASKYCPRSSLKQKSRERHKPGPRSRRWITCGDVEPNTTLKRKHNLLRIKRLKFGYNIENSDRTSKIEI